MITGSATLPLPQFPPILFSRLRFLDSRTRLPQSLEQATPQQTSAQQIELTMWQLEV